MPGRQVSADHVRERCGVPGCRRVDREVFGRGVLRESHDIRYFLTSLDPGTVEPRDLQKLVRDHWQVETSLHFVKDRCQWLHEHIATQHDRWVLDSTRERQLQTLEARKMPKFPK